MKILIVDDDQIALDLLYSALTAAYYDNVTAADSAESALNKLWTESVSYDCILLDIRMPGMDGIELCKLIRKMPSYKSIPIIMITAVTEQSGIDRAIAAGATDYVTKPFNGVELGVRLRSAFMLSDMLRLNQKETHHVRQLRNQLEKCNSYEFDSPIPLESGDGIMSDLQMENNLLKLPDGVYRMEIITIAVANASEIFENLSPIEFRSFLNAVALRAIAACGSNSAKIAYFGSGVFAIVAKNTRRPNSLEAGILLAVENQVYSELAGKNNQPDFVSAKSKHTDYWSGDLAAKGLIEGLRKVQSKCADRLVHSKLAAFRLDSEECKTRQTPKEWLKSSLLAFGSTESCVRPRRVTREHIAT